MLSRAEDLTLFLLRRRVTRQLLWILFHRGTTAVYDKEGEKIEKYQDLKKEIEKLWGIRQQEVVPVVVGAVSKRLDTWLDKLGITIRTGFLQKKALLGTARILRKVLVR